MEPGVCVGGFASRPPVRGEGCLGTEGGWFVPAPCPLTWRLQERWMARLKFLRDVRRVNVHHADVQQHDRPIVRRARLYSAVRGEELVQLFPRPLTAAISKQWPLLADRAGDQHVVREVRSQEGAQFLQKMSFVLTLGIGVDRCRFVRSHILGRSLDIGMRGRRRRLFARRH